MGRLDQVVEVGVAETINIMQCEQVEIVIVRLVFRYTSVGTAEHIKRVSVCYPVTLMVLFYSKQCKQNNIMKKISSQP